MIDKRDGTTKTLKRGDGAGVIPAGQSWQASKGGGAGKKGGEARQMMCVHATRAPTGASFVLWSGVRAVPIKNIRFRLSTVSRYHGENGFPEKRNPGRV